MILHEIVLKKTLVEKERLSSMFLSAIEKDRAQFLGTHSEVCDLKRFKIEFCYTEKKMDSLK